MLHGTICYAATHERSGSLLSDFKLRQLPLLVALDNERKLHLAASCLNMSQPTASKMLAEIEAITRVPLFDRTARGVEPTAYGAIVIRGARSVLAEIDQASSELLEYNAGGIGTVSIGAVAGASIDLAIEIIHDLGGKLDRLRVQFEVDNSATLVGRLNAYHYDFIVARIPANLDTQDLDYVEIGHEYATFLARNEHPLLRQDIVQLEETVDLQWICEPRESFIRQNLERLFLSRSLSPPQRVIATISYIAAFGIAARTDAIVPAPLLALDLLDPKRFSPLPIPDRLEIGAYGLIKLKHRTLPPAAQLIYELGKRSRLGHVDGVVPSGAG